MAIPPYMLGAITDHYRVTNDPRLVTQEASNQMAAQATIPQPTFEYRYNSQEDGGPLNHSIKFFLTRKGLQARFYVKGENDGDMYISSILENQIFLESEIPSEKLSLASLTEDLKKNILDDLPNCKIRVNSDQEGDRKIIKSIIIYSEPFIQSRLPQPLYEKFYSSRGNRLLDRSLKFYQINTKLRARITAIGDKQVVGFLKEKDLIVSKTYEIFAETFSFLDRREKEFLKANLSRCQFQMVLAKGPHEKIKNILIFPAVDLVTPPADIAPPPPSNVEEKDDSDDEMTRA